MVRNIHLWDGTKANLYDKSFGYGDALTSDLRTQKNTLSVWQINDQAELDGVIAALALNRDNVQKLAYIILDEQEIARLGIPLKPQTGQADGMIDSTILNKHVNLDKIDYWRIGYLAEYLSKLSQDEKMHGQKTESEVRKILHYHIDNNKIKVDEMKVGLQKSLGL